MATLKNYIATSTQKVFQIQHDSSTEYIYFGNVEKHDNAFNTEMPINRGCLQFANSNLGLGLIHPLYESSTILFHGLGARRHRYPYAKKDDYQHIYHGTTTTNSDSVVSHLGNGLTSVVKAGDAVYGLDTESTIGHYYVNDEMYDWLAQDNGYAFPTSTQQKTYLYRDEDEIVNNIDLTQLSTTVSAVVDGVKYNTLFEVPGGLYTNYSSGSMFATTVKTKNQYNGNYDMNGNENCLKEVRKYDGIFSNNDQVYLIYHTIMKTDNSANELYQFSNVRSQNNIAFKNANQLQSRYIKTADSRPQVEVIQNLNRGVDPAKHKSTLYKLKLTAPFVDDLHLTDPADENLERLKTNVKQELRNMIRSLTEKVAPANSQLFNVEINNDLSEYKALNYIKVSLDANGGTGGFVKYYAKGDVITLPLPSRVGYVFDGWYVENDSSQMSYPYGAVYVVGATDSRLIANWREKVIRYSFLDLDGKVCNFLIGTYGGEINSLSVNNILSTNKFETAKAGYDFVGFSPDVSAFPTFGAEDVNVVPVYEPKLLEVDFDNEFRFIDWNKLGSTEITANTSDSHNLCCLYNVNERTGVYQIGVHSTTNDTYTINTISKLDTSDKYTTYAMILSAGIDYKVDFNVNAPSQVSAILKYRTSNNHIDERLVDSNTHLVTIPSSSDCISAYADLKFTFNYDRDNPALSSNILVISDIRVFPASSDAVKCSELRRVYRYSETGTYQTLPIPTTTTNKVFDGWYPLSYEAMCTKIRKSKRYEWKQVHRIDSTSKLLPQCHTLYSYWSDSV